MRERPSNHSDLQLRQRTVVPEVFKQAFQVEQGQEGGFSFDLSVERELILRYGDDYWEHFRSNAIYYANETYGKVREDQYKHEVFKKDHGYEVGYWIGKQWVDARNSYAQVAQDVTRPAWVRRRALGDVKWVDSILKHLNNGDFHKILVDLSPTEFEIPLEERKREQFNKHSFVRLHEVQEEEGRLRLVSTPLRNYLCLEEQEKLFQILTGKFIEGKKLLGTVEVLNPDTDVNLVWQNIQELYSNTPLERKITIPKEDYFQKTTEEMKEVLDLLDGYLQGIFKLMKNHSVAEEVIEKQFHAWETAVRKLIRGEEIDKEFFANFNPDSLLQKKVQGASVIQNIVRDYRPEANDCPGSGSGFGKSGRWKNEQKKANGESCVEICCRRCGWKPDSAQLKMIDKGLINRCPTCGWRPGEGV